MEVDLPGSLRPQLAELHIADPPERWRALGFDVDDDARLTLGGIRVQLGGQGPGRGITSWGIKGVTDDIDGLPTTSAPPAREPTAPTTHPNGATGIDHVVIVTPDFDRTAHALGEAGMPLRRIRETEAGFRQGFRRLGPAILELVEASGEDRSNPAIFWGLVVIVDDLDGLKRSLGDRLADPKAAVQPGRRIATLRKSAGLTTNVAFMTPES